MWQFYYVMDEESYQRNLTRPVPILNVTESFRRKRNGSHFSPPRPPIKSAPPISRLFKNRNNSNSVPLNVSFRNRRKSSPIKSPYYDNKGTDLYLNQCFHILGHLGSGSFGDVFKVQSKEDGQFYAIKRSRDRFRSMGDRKLKLEEVNRHENIDEHVNCVRFIKAWEERQQLYIQTELCEMSLKDYSDRLPNIAEFEIWNIIADLCLGLKHLHDNGITHMDIKPANLFLGRDGYYKIGDFGLAVQLSKEPPSHIQEGDPKYLAPEMMQLQLSPAVDVFSLGITVLELSCSIDIPPGGRLWHQLRQGAIPFEITDGLHLSISLINLITRMMAPNPTERPSVDELLYYPNVKQVLRRRAFSGFLNQMGSVSYSLFNSFVSALKFPYQLFYKAFPYNGDVLDRTNQSSICDDFDDDDQHIKDIQCCDSPADVTQIQPMRLECDIQSVSPFQQSLLRDSGICNDSINSADHRPTSSFMTYTPTKSSHNLVSSSPIFTCNDNHDNVSITNDATVGPRNLMLSFDEAASPI